MTPELTFHAIDEVPATEWLALLNSEQVRKYLLPHPAFTLSSAQAWLRNKALQSQQPGCKLQAIKADGQLAGWCGIQLEAGQHEVALVLSPQHWGHGKAIIAQIKHWGQAFGHTHLLAHLPAARPQSRALARLFGEPVSKMQIQGYAYNTYRIAL